MSILVENLLMNAIWQFMKRNYKIILVVVALAAALWSFIPNKQDSEPDRDKETFLLGILNYVLKNAHYEPTELDDAFSKKVYDNFLLNLDSNKRFLLESDIAIFKKHETTIDNEFKKQRIDFFNTAYPIFMQRLKDAQVYYKEILEEPFDFNVSESIDTDYEKQAYAASEEELRERWRKQLKLSVLSSIQSKEKLQENDTLNTEAFKEFAELEKEARESVLKSLDDFFERFQEFTREEWLSVYINTILEQYDPHTSYFAPDDKQRFDESMAGEMEGIGAVLRKKDEYVEITEVVPGGPAMKQGDLENGDVVMKVGQGDEEAVDISGMRLEKVVKMIKGKKDTEVRLTVRKMDGTIEIISIIRDKFEIAETFAKSSIIQTEDIKFGIIHLPKFYISFENRDNRDAFKDVAKELEYLKEQNVEGIIMDLRNNGGGSLQTVVDMVGLFIEQGPVVQVKTKSGSRDVLYDRDRNIQWDGPLVVLINNYSASASEIFAAAIQDYNRGLVLGSKHSFGKGTVQNLFDLNRFGNNKIGDLGAVKFTTQKFYRVNGGSTQLKGVESDVVLPDRFLYIDTGERDKDNAMAWDKIEKAEYIKFDFDLKSAIEKSNQRIAQKSEFTLLDESAKWVKEQQDDYTFPLKYEDYKAKLLNIEKQTKRFNVLKDYKSNLIFESLPYEIEAIATDTVLQNKRDRWHKSLRNDLYVEEAVNVLRDLKNS